MFIKFIGLIYYLIERIHNCAVCLVIFLFLCYVVTHALYVICKLKVFFSLLILSVMKVFVRKIKKLLPRLNEKEMYIIGEFPWSHMRICIYTSVINCCIFFFILMHIFCFYSRLMLILDYI